MTVAELISSRENDWLALEELVDEFGKPRLLRRRSPEDVARLAALYRAIGADLALAETYNLPPNVVARLNNLVGKAYACLYRRAYSKGRGFWSIFFYESPRWIITDWIFWVALALFWIPFLVCMSASQVNPSFAEDVIGAAALASYRHMYSDEFESSAFDRLPMLAFYAYNNGGIGFKCFAYSLLGCFPGIFVLLTNAINIGCVYGYMSSAACTSDISANFYEFTRAHAPFELTAITLSAAAGLRIGFGFIWTHGYRRFDSMRREAIKACPALICAFVFFCLAAFIEAFVSPSPMRLLAEEFGQDAPLVAKLVIMVLSIIAIATYFLVLGGASIVRASGAVNLKEYWIGVALPKIKKITRRITSRSDVESEQGWG